MNKISMDIKDDLVKLLRKEFEHKDKYQGKWEYQWVMGASIRKETLEEYLVRVTVKTSESPYIDGMDIKVYVIDEEVKLEDNFYENGPDLMGSPEADAIAWIEKLDEIIYLQLENPYKKKTYLERLEEAIDEYTFETIGEYNSFDSHVRNIENLYKALLLEVLLLDVDDIDMEGREAIPGEYDLQVRMKDRLFTMYANDKHTKMDMAREVLDKIIRPIEEADDNER